jgi:CubicO group peptidase (beta-lactamase class C family)
MRKTTSLPVVALVAAAVLSGSAQQPAGPPSSPQGVKGPAPRFTDPARREKLARAFPEIDRRAREFAQSNHVPGAAWAVVVDRELAHVGVAGVQQVGRPAAVDGDTVFRIASMTKSFTAMAILALRDAGKLSLDDPADRYVPELEHLGYPTADSPRITVRHLLTHSAGFPEDNPWGDQQLAESEEQFTARMRAGFPFSNPPGVEGEGA